MIAQCLTKAIVCVMAITPLQPVQAAFPGKNGLIGFQHYLGWPDMDIDVMDPDGSDLRVLIPNSLDSPGGLNWSPSGKKILFHTCTLGLCGPREVWVANFDGTNPIKLTENTFDDADACWSNDGSRIAFVSDRDGDPEIYVMQADGSQTTRLTKSKGTDSDPAWSPDGAKIAFSSNRSGNYAVYLMNPDGSNVVRLTKNTTDDFYPNWSPDGKNIVFVSSRDGNNEIYVMNADGSRQFDLSDNSGSDAFPSWSPDGKKIAFSSNRSGEDLIYTMSVDGSGQIAITSIHGLFPDWQPIPATSPAHGTPIISLGDINNDTGPELAVVSHNAERKTTVAQVKSAKTGLLVKKVAFDGRYAPIAVNNVNDLNGNGANEIALLGVREADQVVQVEVRDPLTGAQLSTVALPPSWPPLDLAVIRAPRGSGTANLAVLQKSDAGLRVQLRGALSGRLVGIVTFSSTGFDGIDLRILPDLDGNGAPELAVLKDATKNSVADVVEIRDSVTGQLVQTIDFGAGKTPQQLVSLPDLNDNDSGELAVLRTGSARVLVADAKTGQALNTLDFRLAQPYQLAGVADSDQGTADLALLGERATDGQIRANVHDVLTDTRVAQIVFDQYGTTIGFIAIADISGDGIAELVRLREQPGPQKLFAEVRDGRTGKLLQGIYF